MEDPIKRQIIGIRSKYSERILELLAQEGELYHGDLSEKLNMSPSGLNAIIRKMQECDPPIIEIMQIGKYKIYTLPAAVKENIENKKNEKNNAVEQDAEGGFKPCESENVLLCMQHFIDKAGESWRTILNLLLQDADCDADIEVKKYFGKLMEVIVNASKYNEEEIDELNKFFNNDVLGYLIQEYLDEIDECEEILRQVEARENGAKLVRHFKIR